MLLFKLRWLSISAPRGFEQLESAMGVLCQQTRSNKAFTAGDGAGGKKHEDRN